MFGQHPHPQYREGEREREREKKTKTKIKILLKKCNIITTVCLPKIRPDVATEASA